MATYFLRIEDDKLWEQFRIKAIQEKKPLNRILLGLIKLYIKGKVEIEDSK